MIAAAKTLFPDQGMVTVPRGRILGGHTEPTTVAQAAQEADSSDLSGAPASALAQAPAGHPCSPARLGPHPSPRLGAGPPRHPPRCSGWELLLLPLTASRTPHCWTPRPWGPPSLVGGEAVQLWGVLAPLTLAVGPQCCLPWAQPRGWRLVMWRVDRGAEPAVRGWAAGKGMGAGLGS